MEDKIGVYTPDVNIVLKDAMGFQSNYKEIAYKLEQLNDWFDDILHEDQVIFWKNIKRCFKFLKSFLYHFDKDLFLYEKSSNEVMNLIFDLYRHVLIIFKQMSRTLDNGLLIQEIEYQDIIYYQLCLNTPLLLRLCDLYGSTNSDHVKQIIAGFFEHEPRLIHDVDHVVSYIVKKIKPPLSNSLEIINDISTQLSYIAKYFPVVEILFNHKVHVLTAFLRLNLKQLAKELVIVYELRAKCMHNLLMIVVEMCNGVMSKENLLHDFIRELSGYSVPDCLPAVGIKLCEYSKLWFKLMQDGQIREELIRLLSTEKDYLEIEILRAESFKELKELLITF